jgi:pimeloyl-ACP methyl ester carboxylesterase
MHTPITHSVGRAAALLAAAIALIAGFPVSPAAHAATTPITRGNVEVGDYSLYISCLGSGGPTIVLDGASFVETWLYIQPVLADSARVCAYDRAGLGMSDDSPRPLTVGRMATALHRLLHRAGLTGPYVLVGHALGGTTVRLFASRYPREVAGVVLVDALPAHLLAHGLVPNTDTIDFAASKRELRTARGLGKTPLIVLRHLIPYSYPQPVEQVWPAYQKQLARLSTNHLSLTADCGWDIPGVLPEAVVRSVYTMLQALSRPDHALVARQSGGTRDVTGR